MLSPEYCGKIIAALIQTCQGQHPDITLELRLTKEKDNPSAEGVPTLFLGRVRKVPAPGGVVVETQMQPIAYLIDPEEFRGKREIVEEEKPPGADKPAIIAPDPNKKLILPFNHDRG